MRIWAPLIAILFASTLFVAFPDINHAMEMADTSTELTPDDIVWAKKSLSLYRDGYYVQPFLMSNDFISWHNYTWQLMDHAMFLFLTFLLLLKSDDSEYPYVRWFFTILFVNMVDSMVLTHGNPYFYIQEFPITYNVISVPLYCFICIVIHYNHGDDYRSF